MKCQLCWLEIANDFLVTYTSKLTGFEYYYHHQCCETDKNYKVILNAISYLENRKSWSMKL